MNKMERPEKDIHYWEHVSDSYLRNCSLRDISKTLPLRTTAKRTLALYLRWLEVQRCSDSKATHHWENTVMHWTQALRSRGFTEEEVNKGVKQWRRSADYKQGEGKSMPSWEDVDGVYEKRGLTDIESERKGRVEMDRAERKEERRAMRKEEDRKKERFEKRSPVKYGRKEPFWQRDFEDKYAGTPYPGYICKRCGGSGHHLQACPTSLDPKWDDPPEQDYECTLCGLYGEHYKSLCPRNTDPNCLNQKRKRAGVITPEKKPRTARADYKDYKDHQSREQPEWNATPNKTDQQHDLYRYSPTTINPTLGRRPELFSLDQNPNRLPAKTKTDTLPLSLSIDTSRRQRELFALDQKRDRLLAEDKADPIHTSILKMKSEQSSSPSPVSRKRAREYPSNEDNFGRLSLSASSSSPEESRKRVRFAEPTSPRKSGSKFAARAKMEEGASAVGGEMKFELTSDGIPRFPPLQSRFSPLRFAEQRSKVRFAEYLVESSEMADLSDSSSADGEKIPIRARENKYSAFVLALLKKRPEISTTINVRRYSTAVETWEACARLDITSENQDSASDSTSPDQFQHLTSSPPAHIEADAEEGYLSFDGVAGDRSPHYQGRGRSTYPHDGMVKQFDGYQKSKVENADGDIVMDGAEVMDKSDGVKVDVMEFMEVST